MKEVCVWCPKEVQVPDTFDRFRHTAVCPDHVVTEHLFRFCYSDEEINRREHYQRLTRGLPHA